MNYHGGELAEYFCRVANGMAHEVNSSLLLCCRSSANHYNYAQILPLLVLVSSQSTIQIRRPSIRVENAVLERAAISCLCDHRGQSLSGVCCLVRSLTFPADVLQPQYNITGLKQQPIDTNTH